MIQELIKVEKNNTGDLIVSARQLHEFLDISERFNNWMNRMFKYGFEENEEYTPLTFLHPQNNQEIQDYALVIDMAKEISMLQRSDKGKQARRYFIRCEKQARQLTPNFSNPAEAARAWADQYEKRQIAEAREEALRIENTAMKPKAEFFDAVTDSKTAIEMGQVAKVLNYKKVGRNKLFGILRELEVLRMNNEPYQTYIDNGCFRTVEQKYSKSDGSTHINIKTLVFQKGVDMIRRKLDKLGYQKP